jgi:Uma2 family endonuclease
MTTTKLQLTPSDHGKRLSLDEWDNADCLPGYKYELIRGNLYVSPVPNQPENFLEEWIGLALRLYAVQNPDVINYVSAKSRVFLEEEPEEATVPEPDLSAYCGYTVSESRESRNWSESKPVLVIEVLVDGDEERDLTRNPELYLQLPSIKEYWVVDGRANWRLPSIICHRRYGKRWVIRTHAAGTIFTSRILPGFELLIQPIPQ